jgi:pyruvate formate lyase activating enzyme
VDTSGSISGDSILPVLQRANLFLLDIKHTLPRAYQELTGSNLTYTLHFLKECTRLGKDVIIRQVILPGINDTCEDMSRLAIIVNENSSVKKVELLPYHTLGIYKWQRLGMDYSLKDMKEPSRQKMEELNAVLNASINNHKEV